MVDRTSRWITSGGLVAGSALGLAGTFVASVPVRGLLWGLDGVLLVVAAGFLVYVAGQALVLSTAAMDLAAAGPLFGAGSGLWAAALFLVSAPKVASPWVRIAGGIAAALFAVVAVRLFMGQAVTALSKPLPFFAYPFLVATLVGWALEPWKRASG